jgi:hypothetical protein
MIFLVTVSISFRMPRVEDARGSRNSYLGDDSAGILGKIPMWHER